MDQRAKEVVRKLKEKKDNLAGMWGIDHVRNDLNSIITAIENGRDTVRLRLTRQSAMFSFMENILAQADVELIETSVYGVYEIVIVEDDGLVLELTPVAKSVEEELEEDYGLSM